MARNSFTSMTNSDSFVVVNGVRMTQSEYRKQLKAKGVIKPKAKVKKQPTEIMLQAEQIDKMISKAKTLYSFIAYKRHGYRQWGTIVNTIMAIEGIRKPYIRYVAKYYDIQNLLKQIKDCGKRNEKALYGYLEDLSYRLYDIYDILLEVSKGVSRSGILDRYANEKCIFETGRRLGMKVLLSKTHETCTDILRIATTCGDFSKDGIDPFEYSTKSLNGMISCWSSNER